MHKEILKTIDDCLQAGCKVDQNLFINRYEANLLNNRDQSQPKNQDIYMGFELVKSASNISA